VAPDLPDIAPKAVEPECWPMGTTSDFVRREAAEGFARDEVVQNMPVPAPPPMFGAFAGMSVLKSEARRVVATSLGDYKLYSLVEPTTVAAMQTKQIRFLHQTGVSFETLYVSRQGPYVSADNIGGVQPADVVLRFQNKTANGLGLPIPAGMVSLRQVQGPGGGREFFVGEHGVRDVPTGEEFELEAGYASDVEVKGEVVSDQSVGRGAGERDRMALRYTLTNAKPAPVTFELRQSPARQGFTVVSESSPHVLKNGDDVWRVTLPANGTAVLSYTFEAR
jgi:hypothetical protein